MATNAASLAVIVIDVPRAAHSVMDDRKVGAEEITIVALVADTAIEAPFCLARRDFNRNLQIDFIKGPDPLVGYKPRLRHPAGIAKIIRVDLPIPDYVTVLLATGPAHVRFHRKRYAVSHPAGFEFREYSIGALPEERIERQGGLLPGSDGMDDALYVVRNIPTVNKRRRPVFLHEGTASEIQDTRT